MSTYEYKTIDRASEALIDKMVVRSNNSEDEPMQGRVVGADRTYLFVLWRGQGTPTKHTRHELLLVVDTKEAMTKTLKWSGKTVGELERFLRQVRREGGDDKTALNPGKQEHVGLVVQLPLATDDEPKDNHGRSPSDPEWGREAGMD